MAGALFCQAFESTAPIINPRPRIVSNKLSSSLSDSRCFLIKAPLFNTPDSISGVFIFLNAAPATAVTIGLPPKVVPWSPGLKLCANFSVQSMAPIGSPPPSALAMVTISGISFCSELSGVSAVSGDTSDAVSSH